MLVAADVGREVVGEVDDEAGGVGVNPFLCSIV